MIVTRYGRASKNWPRHDGQDRRRARRSAGASLIDWPSACDDANSSAAPNAPIGVQRPTIIAARPMNPRPAVMPGLERVGRLHAQVGAGQAGEDAADRITFR